MFSVELSSHFQANCNKNIVEVHEQSPGFSGWKTALVHQIQAIRVQSLLQHLHHVLTCRNLSFSKQQPL